MPPPHPTLAVAFLSWQVDRSRVTITQRSLIRPWAKENKKKNELQPYWSIWLRFTTSRRVRVGGQISFANMDGLLRAATIIVFFPVLFRFIVIPSLGIEKPYCRAMTSLTNCVTLVVSLEEISQLSFATEGIYISYMCHRGL